MKKRLGIVVLLALGGAALWWFARPAQDAPPLAKVAEIPTVLKPALSVLAPKPAQVAAPKSAPVPASAETTTSTQAPVNPQGDLQTLIPDEISRLQAGDYVAWVKNGIPPDVIQRLIDSGQVSSIEALAEDQRQYIEKNFGGPEQMIRALQLIQQLTPMMDSTGTGAIYNINDPTCTVKSLPFHQINGLWYLR